MQMKKQHGFLYTCIFVTDKSIFVYLATTHNEQHNILIKEYELDRITCVINS